MPAQLTPNDPEVMLALGSAYMSNVRPVLSDPHLPPISGALARSRAR